MCAYAMWNFLRDHWKNIFSGLGTALVLGAIGFFADFVLSSNSSPPSIKLISMTKEPQDEDGARKQKINLILKNNGGTSAFLVGGIVFSDAKETIDSCIQRSFSLSEADWTYDIDIDDKESSFVGKHAIAPNEIVNFNVVVGRKTGGHELTVYRSFIRLEFDEGAPLKIGPFHLMISGPTIVMAWVQAPGPAAEEWGECQASNIRRLEQIGFDYRPFIHPNSRHYVEEFAPGIFAESSQRSFRRPRGKM